MAVSTTEVVFVILLGVGLLIAIWFFFVERNKRNNLTTQTYTRGVNLAGPGNVLLTCDSDSQICITRATQVCTSPSTANFESSPLDAMTKTGDFDSSKIADLTSDDLGTQCNGKETCTYTFTGTKPFPNDAQCTGQTHLIGTYTCIAKGATCG